jgi:hypothetical protein
MTTGFVAPVFGESTEPGLGIGWGVGPPRGLPTDGRKSRGGRQPISPDPADSLSPGIGNEVISWPGRRREEQILDRDGWG